mmetsp:Transcript_40466/g.96183  ORF Transcript_40466/g.96183 Transcript_40466/m.96183 type:complete len:1063 (+) Transcript_40466:234-3422(+)
MVSKRVRDDSASSSQRKRPRANTRAGSILKVYVKNFMTYKECTIEPGPRLNLVLGANGTGKSSFVCALCVGLNGSTKLLGRADNVKEFIRRGQSEAVTDIVIASEDPARPHQVQRRMKLDSNSSEWRVDGRPSNGSDVKALVSKYNIQLDNLCQFLPQDKVVEFAKLKPQELLIATEKALGDAHLHKMHTELVEVRNNMKNNKNTLDNLTQQLHELRQANQALERDVQRLRERERLMDEITIREKKKPWLKHDAFHREYKEKKHGLPQLKREAEALRQEVEAEERPRREAQNWKDETSRKVTTLRQKLQSLESRRAAIDEDIEREGNSIEEIRSGIEGLAMESDERLRKIEASRSKLIGLRARLEQLPQVPENPRDQALTSETSELDMQMRNVDEDVLDLERNLATLRRQLDETDGKISKLDDHKRRKVAQLDNRFPGLLKVWEWLQDNAGRFFGKVWGPVITEISVEDEGMASFLEMQVPPRVWAYLITEHASDQKLLIQQCQSLLGPRNPIVVTNYAGNPNQPLNYPRGRAADYQEYGIIATLDEVLQETPSIIKHVLNDEASITSAFVARAELQSRYFEFLESNPNVSCLYMPDTKVSVITSRYNRAARSQEVVGIRPCRFLRDMGSETEREQLVQRRSELQANISDITHKISRLNQDKGKIMETLSVKHAEIQKIREARRRAAEQRRHANAALRTEERNLSSLEALPDPAEREAAMREELEGRCRVLAAKVSDYLTAIREGAAAIRALAAAELAAAEAVAIVNNLQAQSSRKREELRAAEGRLAAATAEAKEMKEATKRAKDAANRLAPFPDDAEERAVFKQRLSSVSDDVDVLDQEIDDLTAQANRIACSNPGAVEEYAERQRRIKDLEAKERNEHTTVEEARRRIASLKEQWLPELKELVAKINDKFSVNFAEIGFAGEVFLKEDDDFDKYEIQIKVKFRAEEQLNVLTASRQSGGERSVCTILYLIALQGVTYCPFRVVDEINQGMDPTNERKVFKQLVECACRPDTPQCFLLTPKLLPNLPFSEDVKVLNIFNGPWLGDVPKPFAFEDLFGSRA